MNYDDMDVRPDYGPGVPTLRRSTSRLGKLRQAAGFTQQELADLLDVKLRTLQTWEAGQHLPTGRKLTLYAELLKVPVGEVVQEASDPSQLDRIEAKVDKIIDLLDTTADADREGFQEAIRLALQRVAPRSDTQ